MEPANQSRTPRDLGLCHTNKRQPIKDNELAQMLNLFSRSQRGTDFEDQLRCRDDANLQT
ncbi:hypothetical protein L195_g058574, partial [Trifolium pratense]